jgi:hypothetical protein
LPLAATAAGSRNRRLVEYYHLIFFTGAQQKKGNLQHFLIK